MKATFINNTSEPLPFATGESSELWINRNGHTADPPITVNSEPTSDVAPGAAFSYDITVNVSQFRNTRLVIDFRGHRHESGPVLPAEMSLVSVTFTCM